MVNHDSFICHYYKHVTFLVVAFWLGLLVHYAFGMGVAICLVHSLLMAELNLGQMVTMVVIGVLVSISSSKSAIASFAVPE
jgi:hypothetical protein